MKIFSTISFLIFFNLLFLHGQKDTSCFQSLYIDRPLVKSDSNVIVRNHISEIKIYCRTVDDSIPEKIYLGKWIIEVYNGRIISQKWIDTTSSLKNHYIFLYGCAPQIKIEYKKSKIIQALGTIQFNGIKKSNNVEFEFTHLIDKYGRIYRTNVNRRGMRYEDRYYFININYKYDGDFLVESDYDSGGMIEEKNEPFFRLYFEYK